MEWLTKVESSPRRYARRPPRPESAALSAESVTVAGRVGRRFIMWCNIHRIWSDRFGVGVQDWRPAATTRQMRRAPADNTLLCEHFVAFHHAIYYV